MLELEEEGDENLEEKNQGDNIHIVEATDGDNPVVEQAVEQVENEVVDEQLDE